MSVIKASTVTATEFSLLLFGYRDVANAVVATAAAAIDVAKLIKNCVLIKMYIFEQTLSLFLLLLAVQMNEIRVGNRGKENDDGDRELDWIRCFFFHSNFQCSNLY